MLTATRGFKTGSPKSGVQLCCINVVLLCISVGLIKTSVELNIGCVSESGATGSFELGVYSKLAHNKINRGKTGL